MHLPGGCIEVGVAALESVSYSSKFTQHITHLDAPTNWLRKLGMGRSSRLGWGRGGGGGGRGEEEAGGETETETERKRQTPRQIETETETER